MRTSTTFTVTVHAPPATSPYAGFTPTVVVGTTEQLLAALAAATPGTIIGVDPGIYTATRTARDNTPAWSVPTDVSGTSGSPIRIVAKYQAVILADVATNSSRSELRHTGASGYGGTNSGPVFGSSGSDYIEWYGFFVDEQHSYTKQDNGPAVLFGSTGGKIRNCEIRGVTTTWGDNHNGVRAENCDGVEVSHNRIRGFRVTNTSAHNGAGVMTYQVRSSTFANNEITDCGAGLYFKGGFNGSHGFQVRFNRISLCGDALICGQTGLSGGGSTSIDGGADNVVSQNLFHGCTRGLKLTPDTTGSFNWKVRNNTIDAGSTGGTDCATQGNNQVFADGEVSDNLFVLDAGSSTHYLFNGFGRTTQPLPDMFNNRYFAFSGTPHWAYNTASHTDLGAWQALGEDVGSSYGDPQFVDRAAQDYRLQAGSSARLASSTGGPVGCYITGDELIGVAPAT